MPKKDSLKSYFSNLALDFDIDSDSLTVVVDNAHIPLQFDGASTNNNSHDEVFSSSMSALDTVLFPPPFLNEYDRWSSMEGSGVGSDFSLDVPSRSRDDNNNNSNVDELIDSMIEDEQRTRRRRSISPHPSMDSTERMLRELPGEEPLKNYNTFQNNRQSKGRGTRRNLRNRDDTIPMSPIRTKDEDLPSLKNCPYNEQIEAHPNLGARRLPQSVAIGLSNLLKTDSYEFATLLDKVPDVVDGEGGAIPVLDHSTKLASSNIQKDDNNRSPCFIDPFSSARSSLDEEISLKRIYLSATRSPQALSDFPYYSQTLHHTKKAIPLALTPPGSPTRKSGQFTTRSHPRKSPPRLAGHSSLSAVVEIEN